MPGLVRYILRPGPPYRRACLLTLDWGEDIWSVRGLKDQRAGRVECAALFVSLFTGDVFIFANSVKTERSRYRGLFATGRTQSISELSGYGTARTVMD